MAASYTPLGIELQATGENAGTWGTKTNTNLQIIEQISGGYIAKSIAGSAQTTALANIDTGSNTSYSDVSTGSNTSYSDVATGSNTSYNDVTGEAA